MRGYQLWVNLPGAMKMADPWYDDIDTARIPTVALPGGGTLRVISGEVIVGDDAIKGPVRNRPSQPIYLDIDLPANASFEHAVPAGHTTLVHCVDGAVLVGDERKPLEAKQLALMSRDGKVVIATGAAPGRALLIAGKPFKEPIAHYGPFVMNTEAELRQAVDDFRNGRL
jgi:redox-sensitive bicupin YhaK (pirin superfamily)